MSSIASRPDAGIYTIRVSKGAALVPETRALLREWQPGEDAASLAKRVLSSDLLGKATARRAKDIVQRCFGPRFLNPPRCPARYLKKLVEQCPTGDWFRDLCLLYTARSDQLVRDAISSLLSSCIEEGRWTLSVDRTVAFLADAEYRGMMAAPWASETKKKIGRGLLKVLGEFGLLSDEQRKAREIQRFSPHPIAVAYLAFDLHFSRLSDPAVTSHADWELWMLDEAMVRERLDELSRYGLWIFQAAGKVVRITWNSASMEEAVDVLARLDL